MAYLKLYREKLQHNFQHLDELFAKNEISWGVVTKLLCGNKLFLKELIDLGIKEMHDTRISNIKTIKAMAPHVQTVYIKPPAKRSIHNIIRYVDVSFNTDFYTIKMLSDEESMLMGINQSTEKAILGMISNINQHLASAGS